MFNWNNKDPLDDPWPDDRELDRDYWAPPQPQSATSLAELPSDRRRRLAIGLRDDEERIHYTFGASDGPVWPMSFKFSFWTTSSAPGSRKIHDTNTIYSRQPLDQQLLGIRHRLLYQISRYAYHKFNAATNWRTWDRDLRHMIRHVHHACMICARDLNVENLLYRSTTCSSVCSVRLRLSALEVRIPELGSIGTYGENMSALAILWSAAMMAALHRHITPPAPLGINDILAASKVAFQWLQSVDGRAPRAQQEHSFRRGVDHLKGRMLTERFIAWSGTHYRGCLVLHRPLSTHNQALFLYNANPAIELAYAENWERFGRQSSIVFHGTTLDRLYPIMCDGLRYDQRLMQVGRAFGDGVYATDKSEIALLYSRSIDRPAGITGALEMPSGLNVLLVCELLTAHRFWIAPHDYATKIPGNIYVVNEPNMLILRAILVGRHGMDPPALSHQTLQQAIWQFKPQ